MCGRFASKVDAEFERTWQLDASAPAFEESYNIYPTRDVPIVRADNNGNRHCELVRWGLVPFFAQGAPGKYNTSNCRLETMRTAASYRGPWRRGQRCLFPVTYFYEWQPIAGQKTKQPWCIRVLDTEMFALAGLWEASTRADGTVILSATIVTMPANELMATIHSDKKRMPLILPPEAIDAWLSDDASRADAVIEPYPAEGLDAWPVSRWVNNPAHDDAGCIVAV